MSDSALDEMEAKEWEGGVTRRKGTGPSEAARLLGEDGVRLASPSPTASLRRRGFIFLLASIACLATFALYKPLRLRLSPAVPRSCAAANLSKSEPCSFYAVVFDAGSTGTRVHILQLGRERSEGSADGDAASFRLFAETFQEEKPGLSAYAEDPAAAAASLQPLLRLALETVPEGLRGQSPISLKATAGLRLISEAKAEAILDAVRELFSTTPFASTPTLVDILSGEDEGIFGWFTLNYLLHRLPAAEIPVDEESRLPPEKRTAAALDLGGGSTQLTFRVGEEERPNGSVGKVVPLPISDGAAPIRLFTHSYLGNGIMAMRAGVFHRVRGESGSDVTSACLPPGTVVDWRYAGRNYTITGAADASAERCSADARAYVDLQGVAKAPELAERELYLFAYFFDRAAQVGLVPFPNGGPSILGKVADAVAEVCSRRDFGGPEHWRPWLCTDLAYIHALLSHGYGLPEEQRLFFAKKVEGMEVSWALGAGFSLLHQRHLL